MAGEENHEVNVALQRLMTYYVATSPSRFEPATMHVLTELVSEYMDALIERALIDEVRKQLSRANENPIIDALHETLFGTQENDNE